MSTRSKWVVGRGMALPGLMLIMLVSASCSESPVSNQADGGSDILRIEGLPDSLALSVGESHLFKPTLASSSGATVSASDIRVAVSDSSVLRVGPTFIATGLSPGTVSVVISHGSVSRSVSVRVEHVRWRAISGSVDSSCGVSDYGKVFCWGGARADLLSLEQADQICRPMYSSAYTRACTPRPVENVKARGLIAKDILVGVNHTCVLDMEGRAHCWGRNQYGQLGNGSFGGESGTPGLVQGGHVFSSFVQFGYANFTCAMKVDGQVWCWGRQALSDAVALPHSVLGGRPLRSFSTNGETYCAVTAEREALCWGRNDRGQAGDGGREWRIEPVILSRAAIDVRSGSPGCLLEADHTLSCWGPQGMSTYAEKPEVVNTEVAFEALVGGWGSLCALTADGQAYCFGDNSLGQVGDGTTSSAWVPRPVSGNRRFSRVTAGWGQICGIETDSGHGYCWGANTTGQAGSGTTDNLRTPARVLQPLIP
jgi:alpha-tubulin suppressor-like RCC1 family protein